MERNLTVGSIPKGLILFSVPLILGALLQQMYQMVDIIIAGRFLGDQAIAAIGVTASIPFFIVNILNGLTMGASIHISNLYGLGDKGRDNIPKVMGSFFVFLSIISLCIATTGVFLCRTILITFHTPDEIFESAQQYLTIIFIGMPFQALYSLSGAALRGIGNSAASFQAIFTAAFTNVVMNLVLIKGFGAGVAGLALATVFAQLLSCLYLAVVIKSKHKILHFSLLKNHFSPQILWHSIHIGLPIALQNSILTCGGVFAQGIINSLGSDAISGITTAYRIDELSMLPVTHIGSAITTFTAQNRGARNYGRVRSGFWIGMFLAIGSAILTTTFIMANCYSLIRLFGVPDITADYAYQFLKTCSLFYPVYGLEHVCIGMLHGSGHTRITVVGNIIALLTRVVVLYSVSPMIGFVGIPYSEISSWITATVIFLPLCFCCNILPKSEYAPLN